MSSTRLIRSAGALILVMAVSLASIASVPSRAQTDHVYLALGDSIAAGLSSSLPSKRGYPAIVADLMKTHNLASESPDAVEKVNLSVPGETVQSFIDEGQLQAAIDQIDAGDVRVVTLTLGGNDFLALWEMTSSEREADLGRFQDAYGHVIETLSDAVGGDDVDVIVTTYYDLTEGDPDISGTDSWWLARFNQVISDTAINAGFSVVDLADAFRGQIPALTWFPADVHPNNDGHRTIAREIWQALEYDQSGPEVSIRRPESGEARSRLPTIHAAVNDDVGVESVSFAIDGDVVDDLIYIARLDAYVGLWDARDHQSPEAELSVIATDLAGNQSSDTVMITLPAR